MSGLERSPDTTKPRTLAIGRTLFMSGQLFVGLSLGAFGMLYADPVSLSVPGPIGLEPGPTGPSRCFIEEVGVLRHVKGEFGVRSDLVGRSGMPPVPVPGRLSRQPLSPCRWGGFKLPKFSEALLEVGGLSGEVT